MSGWIAAEVCLKGLVVDLSSLEIVFAIREEMG